MDWQLGLTVLCVALASGYLVRRSWRTWSGAGKGCGGGGGAPKAAPPAPLVSTDEPTQRLRARRHVLLGPALAAIEPPFPANPYPCARPRAADEDGPGRDPLMSGLPRHRCPL